MTSDQETQQDAAPAQELHSLKRKKVTLDQLFLDPNNPRLGTSVNVPDARVVEDAIQRDRQSKIEKIGIDDLLSSIRTYGLAPTDPIVVRPLRQDQNRFVVLEGNRRVATLKKLSEAQQKGDQFDEVVLDSIRNLEVLVYEGENPDIVWIVQGLRHMSGIKEWPALQQAEFIAKIEQQVQKREGKRGRPPGLPTVAKTAGVSTSVATRLLRSYYAFQEAQADEEYGSYISADKFSMFAEAIFRKPLLQEWLGWRDESKHFENNDNLKKFLSWIAPSEDAEPKVTRAIDARDILPNIIASPDLLRRFENGSLDIHGANAEIMQRQSERDINLDALKERLEELLGMFDTLPLPKIEREKRGEEFQQLLQTLQQSINTQLSHLGRNI